MKVKNYLFLLAIVLAGFNQATISQSLSEKIGGFKTNFLITSGDQQLNSEEQLIILRGQYNYNNYKGSDEAFGLGYGYQSYHLEFISNVQLSDSKIKDKYARYQLTLWDKEENKLAVIFLKREHLTITETENDLITCYKFDLVHVPFILLDKTHRIDILKNSRF